MAMSGCYMDESQKSTTKTSQSMEAAQRCHVDYKKIKQNLNLLNNDISHTCIYKYIYIYINTLGAWGSPGTPAPRGFIYMKLGWGGVGMVTFLALAHMVGATQVMGWGGVGMVTFLALAHMVVATQHHVPCTCTHGRCYAVAESIASITKSQLRRFGLSKVSRDGIEHRNVLAVHHINQRPGLATVLDALKKHRSLASRSFLSPSQVFKQPLWQVWEKRSHVLMKDKIFFPTKNEMIYFSSHYIHLFKMQRREIISYTLIVVCCLECELFPKCLSMFM